MGGTLDIDEMWGEYPKEYIKAVHGPYHPMVYYGKKDTPLSQVKLKDMFAYIGRRNKSPSAMQACLSRALQRWSHYHHQPVNCGLQGILQVAVGAMIISYCLNWNKYRHHRNYKHQW